MKFLFLKAFLLDSSLIFWYNRNEYIYFAETNACAPVSDPSCPDLNPYILFIYIIAL